MQGKSPKVWSKTNLTPAKVKILKRIAADNDTYIYKIIENTVEEKYPQYFEKKQIENNI